jgi:bifunctional DNA-binding transcriptional regulator/antitoxin component of YhaV-PrlF toxin-antitoxin module
MEVVIKMEYVLKVDRQGRVILPVELRRELGVKKGGSIIIRKKNNRIYIDVHRELEGEVKRWKEKIKGVKVDVEQIGRIESRWVSEDWSRRKLGIQA